MLSKKGAPGRNLERLFLCLLSFSALLTPSISVFAADACNSEYYDETTTIRYIYDGDTLQLGDGRKVRLIGINSPELSRNNKAAEPFALAAKNALSALFKTHKTIALRYGDEKKDRYGRFLAHGFLANGQNIQAILLNQGMARVITIPPNTTLSACYLKQEQKARCKKVGLWKHPLIIQAKNLNSQHAGFQLIKGRVTKIHTNSKGIWLTIGHKLTVGIRPDNQALFDLKRINSLLDQSIMVRGWLNKSKKSTLFYMRIRHPLSIQLPSTLSCH